MSSLWNYKSPASRGADDKIREILNSYSELPLPLEALVDKAIRAGINQRHVAGALTRGLCDGSIKMDAQQMVSLA